MKGKERRRKQKRFCILTAIVIALMVMYAFPINTVVYADTQNDQIHYFNNLHRVKKDKGFTLDEEKTIKDSDKHYGWNLGELYVSGYTLKTTDSDGNPVFMKKVGDKVVLGFKMQQADINKLNGDEDLSIDYDKKGFDQDFGIKKTEFKRGTLIIRHTDYQNKTGDPVIYTDYFSAKSKVNANTTIELNEEGDYEVVVDYSLRYDPRKVKGKSIAPQKYDYTIRTFKFSVRNGNSMVFVFDNETGGELENGDTTESGFKIDFRNSHYLQVSVKKETLNVPNADENGGIESEEPNQDVRFNRPAKDGEVFTDEGEYTITVKEPLTGEETEKVIVIKQPDEAVSEEMQEGIPTYDTMENVDEQLTDGVETSVGSIVASNSVIKKITGSDSSSIKVLVAIMIVAILAMIVISTMVRKRTKE